MVHADPSRGADESETPFYKKLRLSMRLSMLCYESTDALGAWRGGSSVPFAECKLPFGTTFDTWEAEPVAIVFQDEDAETGAYRKAQWLAAKSQGVLYVAFKGTSSVTDLLLDSAINSVVTPSGMRCHSGFYAGVQSELPEVLKACCGAEGAACREIVFTGHSLGGAYATIALLELMSSPLWQHAARCEAITFGAPLSLVAERIDGGACLPPVLSHMPPPIANFVTNYDVVPRGFALDAENLRRLVQELPALIGNSALGSMMNLARTTGLFNTDTLVNAVEHIRCRFRPVGTYVMAQSLLVNQKRYTSATIVPSNQNRVSHRFLNHFPGVRADAEVKARTDFVAQCVADHGVQNYWTVVDAVCARADGGMADDGTDDVTPLCTIVEDVRRRAAEEEEGSYAESLRNFDAFPSLGLAVPNAFLMARLSDADQKAYAYVSAEITRLAHVAAAARTEAIAGLPSGGGSAAAAAEAAAADKEDPVAAAVAACEPATPAEAEKPTGFGLGRFKMPGKKAAAEAIAAATVRKPVPHLVNMVSEPISVVLQKKAAAGDDGSAMKWDIESRSALVLEGRVVAGDTLTLGVSLHGVECTLAIPEAKGERRLLLIEWSFVLGLTVREAKVKDVGDHGPWRPFTTHDKTKERWQHEEVSLLYPRTEPRNVFVDSLTQQLAHSRAGVTVNVVESDPLGAGVQDDAWSKGETCHVCAVKFNQLITTRHHCRACGHSVCNSCSPTTAVLSSYTTAQRCCRPCSHTLAQAEPVEGRRISMNALQQQ